MTTIKTYLIFKQRVFNYPYGCIRAINYQSLLNFLGHMQQAMGDKKYIYGIYGRIMLKWLLEKQALRV
jgi:hypothetical protein